MAGKSFELRKHQVREIKQNIEAKKTEAAQFEKKKEELLGAMTEISGAKLDEGVLETVKDMINSALEENREQAEKTSSEMNEDISRLENIKQETEESIEDAQKNKESLNQKQKILEKINAGGVLENAVQEIDTNLQELESFNNETIETMREAEKVASSLSGL